METSVGPGPAPAATDYVVPAQVRRPRKTPGVQFFPPEELQDFCWKKMMPRISTVLQKLESKIRKQMRQRQIEKVVFRLSKKQNKKGRTPATYLELGLTEKNTKLNQRPARPSSALHGEGRRLPGKGKQNPPSLSSAPGPGAREPCQLFSLGQRGPSNTNRAA